MTSVQVQHKFKLLLPSKFWKKIFYFCFFLVTSMLCFLSVLSYFNLSPFYVNYTDSAPHGLYLRVHGELSYGDYAVVPIPMDITTPGGTTKKGSLLLKKAIAFEGDHYTVRENVLQLVSPLPKTDNSDLTYIQLRSYPINSSSYLPHLSPGNYTVPSNHILFLNDPEGSLDSRYLGPVNKADVISKVVLIVNYDYLLDILSTILPSWFSN